MLRRIASGERADIYLATVDRGWKADGGDGTAPLVALRIYDRTRWGESIAVEIEAMSTDASGALPALYDVAALDDGRCCLAVERIAGVSVSRILAERSVTAGEAVTLLAPTVEAVAELSRRGFVHTRLSAADVLIDDAGRPRLIGLGSLERVPERGGAERTALVRLGHEALAALVSDVSAATRPAGALDGVVELIRTRLAARPFTNCEEEIERALFAAASPEPIAGAAVRTRVQVVPARMTASAVPEPAPPEPSDDETTDSRRRRGALRGLLALAQLPGAGELADVVDGDHVSPVFARLRKAVSSRRRPLAFAGFIGGGALVLLLTLVPPATAGGDSGGTAGAGAAPPNADEAADASSAEAAPPAADANVDGPAGADADTPVVAGSSVVDAATAVAELLELRMSCFATLDLACLDQVVQPGSAMEAEDRAAMIAARDGAGPVSDDFDLGGVAVSAEMGAAVLVTVPFATTEREPASLLVMRGEAGWRLRELFD